MLIYFDVETTGLEAKDRICAIGMIVEDEGEVKTYHELIKPICRVQPEAMAIHHITNEMLHSKKSFQNSEIIKVLDSLNNVNNTLVGHNIVFDVEMLFREEFKWYGGIIDTLKCSRHLIEEIDYFSLQYLRYELGLYKKESQASDLEIPLIAHTPLSDAYHVKLLYEYLLELAPRDELERLSVEPALIKKLTFGKYKDRFLEEIAMGDRGYLEWMLGSMHDMDADLRYSIEYYLGEMS